MIQEFVQLARRAAANWTYGSAGNGSLGHLNGELFKRLVGIEAIHVLLIAWASQAVTDLDDRANFVLDLADCDGAAADPGRAG